MIRHATERIASALRAVLVQGGVYLRALRLLWTAAPGACALMAGLLLVQGVVPPLSIWIVKGVVDAIGAAGDAGRGALLVALWAVASLVGQITSQWILLVTAGLNERFIAHVELTLIRKANSLSDLAAFEDPAFHDDLQTLTREAAYRPLNLLVTTTNLLPNVVSSLGLLALVGSLAWWLPVLLVGATLPVGATYARLQRDSWRTIVGQSPLARALRYFTSIVTTETHAKEVRVLGLGPYFERRYAEAFDDLRRTATEQRRRQASGPVAVSLLFAAVNVLAFWWVADGALGGRFTPGDVVLFLQALVALRQSLGAVANMAALLASHLIFFRQFFDFLEYRSPMRLADPGVPAPRPLREGIVFDAVGYSYANGTRALDGVSVAIRPGERVALVGENGAGKTTLVKLLCRLYDPTEGAILVDGVDLRALDLAAWRANLGAVFQDFGRYNLTVAENIGLGDLETMDDPGAIERAARGAGFAAHAEGLAGGYETQLGPQFGGVELSGGQWQSLGIARALMRDAEILILDEPTAALDPRAEYALYRRFSELALGRTTLLITHRLASVQMADRILVLKGGALVEQGTHAELMRRDGEYASLYRMQAEQYGAVTAG